MTGWAGVRQAVMPSRRLGWPEFWGLAHEYKCLPVWPAVLVWLGLRDFRGPGIFIVKSRQVLGRLGRVSQLTWGMKYMVSASEGRLLSRGGRVSVE